MEMPMPRNSSGVYSLPPGSSFTPNTLIQSAVVNGINNDLATDLNVPRPIVAGGTGATTAAGAQLNLSVGIVSVQTGNLTGLAASPTILLPTTYKAFRLVITDLNFSSGTQPFWAQFSTNGGASWISGATDYFEQTSTAAGAAAVLTQVSQAAASIILTGSRDASQRAFSVIDIDTGNGSQLPTMITTSKWINSGAAMRGASIFTQAGSSLVQANAMRLFPGTGTIITGIFSLYGYL
jgi:hypothetical protein